MSVNLFLMFLFSGDNTWVYILVAVVVVGTGLLLLIIVLCMRRKTKSPKQPSPKAKTVELNALLPKQQQLRAREFPLSNVRFMQELGEGAFGKYSILVSSVPHVACDKVWLKLICIC